jgi:lysyl-tRNA synthetase class 2
MSSDDWKPTALKGAMKARARMLQDIRAFFDAHDVLEVETPLLASHGASDPNMGNLKVRVETGERYLQTSPEYAMKRLLAAGSGDIYQMTHAFRSAEAGVRHNPEFSILEWYRVGMDHHDLMREVEALFQQILAGRLQGPSDEYSYQQIFQKHLDIDPLSCATTELEAKADALGLMPEGELDRDGILDLLMSFAIVPELPKGRLSFVHAWPSSQASLARLLSNQPGCAARFEVYYGDLELANGFWELSDVKEQSMRFAGDNEKRALMGLPSVPGDPDLLAALQSGLPDCAGVAVGLDRLLMALQGAKQISEVINFPWDRS